MLSPEILAARRPGPVGVAVSGGGDSVALLLLAAERLPRADLRVATVDHGLRDGSAAEADWVADLCGRMGLGHRTLHWRDGPSMPGNLAQNAREARRRLLADWIAEEGGGTILLGHTQDDVAETFLMRLARGSGLDGLSAMRPVVESDGCRFLRPVLGVSRDDLRSHLRARGQDWLEDPTNEDVRYDRARVRAALGTLGGIGLTAEALARSARRLSEARDVLADQVRAACGHMVHQDGWGQLHLSLAPFGCAPPAIRRGVLRAVLEHVAGPGHPPRQAALDGLEEGMRAGQARTLGGVALRSDGRIARFFREGSAVATPFTVVGRVAHWDGRWTVSGDIEGGRLGALDRDGLRQCPARPRGLRAEVAATFPALRHGDRLIAAPFLRPDPAIRFRLRHFAEATPPH